MKKWRPVSAIQTKVIGLCVNRGRLLAMEVYDDSGRVKGVRPLGGLIEFGESRETALKREFMEELNSEIDIHGAWHAFENRYVHGGQRGHEYLFAAGVELLNLELYNREIIVFSEDSGTENTARWFDVDALKAGDIELYPDGLRGAFESEQLSYLITSCAE